MARRRQIIVSVLEWSAYAIAACGVAWCSLNTLSGLAGVGLVPAALVGGWFAVASANSERRACGLAWAATFGAAIPSCPWWNGAIPAAAWWCSQQFPSLDWNYLEMTALLLTPVLPLLVVGLLAMAVASFVTFLLRRSAIPRESPTQARAWRFSLRELMITVAVSGLVLGWNMEWFRRGQDKRSENQIAFLNQFNSSFTSGQVELLAEPTMEGLHRSVTRESGYRVFHTPGISEYRIIAPIREGGREKWAVWSYTCGPDNSTGGEHAFQFGYAEAALRSELPAFPFPPKRYIQYAPTMIDGLPSTAGPAAAIVASPASAAVDQPLVIKASAPVGTVCRLMVWPTDAAVHPIADQKPDAKGSVAWSVALRPQSAGGSMRIEVQCIEPRGRQALMHSTPAPNVRLLPARTQK